MDLQIYELTIFTNVIVNNQKFKISTKKFGPFDNMKKVNICCNKKIDKIKNKLKNTLNEYDLQFEYDIIIKDITNEEFNII
jgi:hypothetical protein